LTNVLNTKSPGNDSIKEHSFIHSSIMDLLGGYGSDGSSSCTNIDNNDDELAHDASRIQAMTQQQQQLQQQERKQQQQKLLAIQSIATHKNQRGKKRVSLLAVLPTHIVEQLTQQGTVDNHDYDSDDGGVVVSNTTTNKNDVHHDDADISSFLSELHAAPTRNHISDKTITPIVRKLPVESVGMALISSETVRVSHASRPQEVMDIHGTATSCKDSIIVETVQDMVDDNHLSPKPVSKAPTVPRTSVPRPAAVHAPRVTVPEHASAPILIPAYPTDTIDDKHDPTITKDTSRFDKKRSRKEMEKALRLGNFDTLSGVNVQTLHKPSNAYIIPAPGEAPRHNVKVAPVRMYDTKAGTDVLGATISGKAKGKNQVNHLMAAAAAFELKESQGAFKPKSQKANAKRKYGW
jgi:hypothetical protein